MNVTGPAEGFHSNRSFFRINLDGTHFRLLNLIGNFEKKPMIISFVRWLPLKFNIILTKLVRLILHKQILSLMLMAITVLHGWIFEPSFKL